MDNNNRQQNKELNPITLAFLGDSVFELLVRSYLINNGDKPPEDLHKDAVKFVSAHAQASALQALLPYLTEDEMTYFKRGRNAKVSHIPKGATPAVYHNATGLETLFGKLYVDNKDYRIKELFEIIINSQIGGD